MDDSIKCLHSHLPNCVDVLTSGHRIWMSHSASCIICKNVRSTVAAYIALLPTLATAAGVQGLSQTCTLIGSIHGLGWIGSRSAASWLSDCVVFEARSTILSVLYVTKLIRIEYLCQALSTSRFRRAGSLATAHTCYKWQDLGRRTNQTSFIFARQRSEDRVLCILARLFWRWRDPAPSL